MTSLSRSALSKKLSVALLAVALSALIQPVAANASEAEDLNKQGLQLREKKEYRQAIEMFKRAHAAAIKENNELLKQMCEINLMNTHGEAGDTEHAAEAAKNIGSQAAQDEDKRLGRVATPLIEQCRKEYQRVQYLPASVPADKRAQLNLAAARALISAYEKEGNKYSTECATLHKAIFETSLDAYGFYDTRTLSALKDYEKSEHQSPSNSKRLAGLLDDLEKGLKAGKRGGHPTFRAEVEAGAPKRK